MTINFVDALSALRRRAKLTNQRITDADILNIQEPMFAANRANAPAKIANTQYESTLAEQKRQAADALGMSEKTLAEQKRQAEMSLAQQKSQAEAALSQADEINAENQKMGQISTGVGAVGTGLTGYQLLKPTPTPPVEGAVAEPGIVSTLGTKAVDGLGELIMPGKLAPAGDLLGTEATLAAGGGSAAAGTAVGDAGSLAGVTADSLAGTSVTGGALAAEEGGATLGSLASGVGGGIATAAPYYALAKAGGMGINAITNNNPWMKETPLGLLGETLDEPLAVEDAIGGALARHGVGTEKMWEGMNNANPLEVGGWIKNTGEKLESVATGGLTGMQDFMTEGAKELGIKESHANTIADVATGGITAIVRKACIIITACTDTHSPEVEIAREYRDRFLTPDQLRGYYMIAEKILPFVTKHKGFFKKYLVDNLIEYGRYALDKTSDKPSIPSRIITRLFIGLCWTVGQTRKSFVRANGEVY